MRSNEKSGAEAPRYVNFAAALIGSCAGTEIFKRLRFQSPWRTVGHLVLLSMILGVLIAGGVMLKLAPLLSRGRTQVATEFGAFRLEEKGVFPTREPEKSRILELPSEGKLFYFTTPAELPDLSRNGGGQYSFLWHPRFLALVLPAGDKSATILSLQAGGKPLSEIVEKTVVRERLEKGVTAATATDAPWRFPQYTTVELKDLQFAVHCFAVLWHWYMNTLFLLGMTLLCVTMFVFSFRLLGNRNKMESGAREMWVVSIYASFPPMIAGSVCAALLLPIRYDWIYIFGFIGFLLVILHRLEMRRGNDGNS